MIASLAALPKLLVAPPPLVGSLAFSPQNFLPSRAAEQAGRNPGCLQNLFAILRDIDHLATDGTGEESEFSKF
jgi:hypothetical protein